MNFFEQDLAEWIENIANKLKVQSASLFKQKSSSFFAQRVCHNKVYGK